MTKTDDDDDKYICYMHARYLFYSVPAFTNNDRNDYYYRTTSKKKNHPDHRGKNLLDVDYEFTATT